MEKLVNSEYKFSFFENLYKTEPQDVIDINDLIEIIKYGYLKDVITKLRTHKTKKTYDNIKRTEIPAVTLSGVFTKRNSKGIIDHSGLIQIDIDNLENFDLVQKKIISDPYTYISFRSPGGEGIKVIIKINPDETTHLEQFYALEQYFNNELGIVIDKSCKDVSRCMLLSFDPDLFCNPFSETFLEFCIPEHQAVEKIPHNTSQLNMSSSDEKTVIDQIVSEVENNRIDITVGYHNWISIGFAISSALGESGRGVFHRISSQNPDYDQSKCDRKYTQLNKNNNGTATIGTLIYHARENNIIVRFPGSPITTLSDPAPKDIHDENSESSEQEPHIEKISPKIKANDPSPVASAVEGNQSTNDDQSKIQNLVRKSPGIRIQQIANDLNLNKDNISNFLHSSNRFRQEPYPDYGWHYTGPCDVIAAYTPGTPIATLSDSIPQSTPDEDSEPSEKEPHIAKVFPKIKADELQPVTSIVGANQLTNDDQSKIQNLVRKSPGTRAVQIANALNLNTDYVLRFLHSSNKFKQDPYPDFGWHYKQKIPLNQHGKINYDKLAPPGQAHGDPMKRHINSKKGRFDKME